MDRNEQLIQDPPPGKRMVKFCGDRIGFTLTLPQVQDGSAWIRTNIGQAQTIRREIIRRSNRTKPHWAGPGLIFR
jgi:hypothetical protein